MKFYPFQIERARARFILISDFLSRNPNKRKIERKFSLFHERLKIYNRHLRENFSFCLSKPERFYHQAGLAVYSKDNMDNIKARLKSLTAPSEDKEREPFETIRSLKQMLNEPYSLSSVLIDRKKG